MQAATAGERPRWRLSEADLRKTYASYQQLVDKDCARYAPTPREAAYLRGGVLDERARLAARARVVNQAFFDALIGGLPPAAAAPDASGGGEAASAAPAVAAAPPLEIRDYPGVKVRPATTPGRGRLWRGS